jgi:hypothetical protein
MLLQIYYPMFRKTLACAFFFLAPLSLLCQIRITGRIINKPDKSSIVGANITLQEPYSGSIVAFAISGQEGNYLLIYKKNTFPKDSFDLVVTTLGYGIARKKIYASEIQAVDFYLEAAISDLPNITVTNTRPMVKQRGDTLSYAVDSFASAQDRVIIDIIRKLPGIEVNPDGKISYNGKALSDLYIDGDNLLDDKYNLATNSIPSNMVKDIQILENHQPIKALPKLGRTDRVAMNISLKDTAKIKLIGKAELAAGSNYVYDEVVDLMSFKKKYKSINSIKFNNSGKDISDDFISHNFEDYKKQLELDNPQSLLTPNSPGNPNIGKPNYLFNNAFLFNTNNLVKSSRGLQVKSNIYYYHDNQPQDYRSLDIYYLPTDTIRFDQRQQVKAAFDYLHFNFNLNSNKNKLYFDNSLTAELNTNSNTADMTVNTSGLTQRISARMFSIANLLNLIKPIGRKSALQYNTYLNFTNRPENLDLFPGITAPQINGGASSFGLHQQAAIPTFFINSFISVKIPGNRLLQSYKIGFMGQWQQLSSQATSENANHMLTALPDSFTNRVNWQKYKLYSNCEYTLMWPRSQLYISVPLSVQQLTYVSLPIAKDNNDLVVRVSPRLSFRYETGVKSFLTGSFQLNNTLPSIKDIFPGRIIQNYRTLVSSEILFPQSTTRSLSAGYNYKHTLKLLFFNINALYGSTDKNSILSTLYNNNLIENTIVPFTNQVDFVNVNSGISKYYFPLKGTVSAKFSWQLSNWNQVQNNRNGSFQNINTTWNISLNSKLSRRWNASYDLTYLTNTTRQLDVKQGRAQDQQNKQFQQKLVTTLSTSGNAFITLTAEHFYAQGLANTKTNYLFVHGSLRYKINKLKSDLVIEANNLTNNTGFTTVSISANTYSQQVISIRARTVLLKILFSF